MLSLPMLSLALLVLLTTSLDAADQTVKLEVSQNSGNTFKGQFCFHLDQELNGWEVLIDFTSGVKGIQQWVGDIRGEAGASGSCSQHYVMVNKQYQGHKGAGEQLCISMTATLCGSGTPGGSATLKDLTTDGMTPPPQPALPGQCHAKYNYAEVLEKSIMFYEAQRSGKLPSNNRIPWRGDSALQDHGDNGEDLTGGWYDAGDNVKFNFPMAFSTTLLCWSLLEFPDAYSKAGQLEYMYDSIRWPLEYFVKCHTKPDELYVQVGAGSTDHGTWTSPERMDQNRPAFKVTASKPGSDVAMEMAAAMACGSIVFKNKDATFSNTLLSEAKSVYTFAKTNQGFYSASVQDAMAYYHSQNYTDENNWGAEWLYKATGDRQYLQDSQARYAHEAAWGFSWDEKIAGNHLMMYNFTRDPSFVADIKNTMTAWSKDGGMTYTPKCLAFRLQWGALRYAANTAFFALMAVRYGAVSGAEADAYVAWAMCQIHYALGDTGRSYVVGYGSNPPTKPHHRAASCPMIPLPCSWDAQNNAGPNPHTLYGALVGGPGDSDDYTDDRKDYVHNEVACDYNAGLQAVVAGLLQLCIEGKLPAANVCDSCPQP